MNEYLGGGNILNCKRCGVRKAEYCEKCFVNIPISEKKTFRKAIFKRANRKCERCPEDDIRVLTIHHFDKKLYPNDLEYALVLCLNCHKKAEIIKGNVELE